MTDRDLQPRLVREGLQHLCLVCAGILGNVGGSGRGPHQRCWAPLLRDLHRLKEDHATDAGVVGWALAVRALDDDAPGALGGLPLPAALRTTLARQLEAQAFRLGVRNAGVTGHPCRALARRLLRHQGELCEFVRVAGLTADNSAAERMLPPVVVQCNARLAAAPAVRKAAPIAWPWSRCSTPGAPAASTPSMNASLCCTFLYLKCEHVRDAAYLTRSTNWGTLAHQRLHRCIAVGGRHQPVQHGCWYGATAHAEPELFRQTGVRTPRAVLLSGPPGTGKSLMARALAAETGYSFLTADAATLLSKWVGESEKALCQVFRKARLTAPCIVLFDDVDALVPIR
jgi:hypothetical protein